MTMFVFARMEFATLYSGATINNRGKSERSK